MKEAAGGEVETEGNLDGAPDVPMIATTAALMITTVPRSGCNKIKPAGSPMMAAEMARLFQFFS